MAVIRKVLIFSVLYGLSAVASPAADKSQYWLANPTPKDQLRDLTTDRPDLTESPMTVDAGWYQVEVNAFGFSRSRSDPDGVETDTFEFATTNIRVGLTHNAEIDVVLQPYGVVRSRPSAGLGSSRDDGIGGLDIRGKLNLFGNEAFDDPGDTALALLPFLSLPMDRNNGIGPEAVEGGLIVPFAVVLPDGFGLGITGGVTAARDDGGSGYHAEYLASAALSREWNDRFGTYYEIATILGTDDPRGNILLLGTGFTYLADENLQLDGGVNFGVTSASDRINPFVGITSRF
jgi:hypothetical protein